MNITKPQKLIYDMEKFTGGAIAVICGKKDLSEIKKAVNELYRLNTALRIRVVETDGEVSQMECDICLVACRLHTYGKSGRCGYHYHNTSQQ